MNVVNGLRALLDELNSRQWQRINLAENGTSRRSTMFRVQSRELVAPVIREIK